MMAGDMTTPAPTPAPGPLRRLAPLILIGLALAAFFALRLDRLVTLDALVERRGALQATIAAHPLAAPFAFVLVYAALVAISAPGATVLTLAAGAMFGLWLGVVVALAGATIGACALFLAARSALGARFAKGAGSALGRARAEFQRDAVGYMLFLRLSPLFPFWFVNLAAALSGVRFRTFLWTTIAGILPASFVFVAAGASVDSLASRALAARQACQTAGRGDCALHIPLSAVVTPQIFALLLGLSFVALAPAAARKFGRRAGRSDGMNDEARQ